MGIIDGVLSDDVDALLFGAKLVLPSKCRQSNSSICHADRTSPSPTLTGNLNHSLPSAEHTTTYAISDIISSPFVQLTWEGLILIALLCGNDYHTGVPGCGMKIAVGLARCGFGERLLVAFRTCIDSQRHDGTKSFMQWLV